MPRQSTNSPDAAWSEDAPTACSPESTIAKAVKNPTMAAILRRRVGSHVGARFDVASYSREQIESNADALGQAVVADRAAIESAKANIGASTAALETGGPASKTVHVPKAAVGEVAAVKEPAERKEVVEAAPRRFDVEASGEPPLPRPPLPPPF